jgi:hypothetical protein
MEILRQDMGLLDSRRFVDYSYLVMSQEYNREADEKFANMLHFKHNGRDLHLVVGLIDFIGLKSSGRKFQSNHWQATALFDQNKYKVYPYYLMCLGNYLFDSQSCLLENPTCSEQSCARSSPGCSAFNLSSSDDVKSVVSHIDDTVALPSNKQKKYSTDTDRRHVALMRDDPCDFTLTCRSLIFSSSVRGNFEECKQDSLKNQPAGAMQRGTTEPCCPNGLRFLTPDGSAIRSEAVDLFKPKEFKMYWASSFKDNYYKYYFFLTMEHQGSLCWMNADQCNKTKCTQRAQPTRQENIEGCEPNCACAPLKQVEAIYSRPSPSNGRGRTRGLPAGTMGLFMPGAWNSKMSETVEFFGLAEEIQTWEQELKHIVGFDSSLAVDS